MTKDVRSVLLEAVESTKGNGTRVAIESGGDLHDDIDSSDLLEILLDFDERAGVVTDPQLLSSAMVSFDDVVSELMRLHGDALA